MSHDGSSQHREITGHKAQAQPEGTEWWACSNESGMTEKR
jgi:hypothetical protein